MPSANTVKKSDFSVELTAQSEKTLAKLIVADLMADLRAEVTEATTPLAPAAKTAARSLPSSRSRRKTPGGSLRSAVANSISRKIKLTPRSVMVVITTMNKGGKSNLGRVLEGDIPWQHPVFGSATTVTQKPEPFFFRTLNAMMPGVASKIEETMTKFERKV